MDTQKYLSVLLAIAILLRTGPTFATDPAPAPLTLPAALDIARAGNPDLRTRDLAAGAVHWAEWEALSEHLPHLDARASHLLAAKYGQLNIVFGGSTVEFPTAFPQTEVDLEATWLVFDGFGAINRYRAARLESEAARLEAARERFRLEKQVELSFYRALAARGLLRVADQNIETLEQHLHLAKASRSAGFSTDIDVLRLESLLEEARAERILADDRVVLTRQELGELLGAEGGDEVPLSGSLPEPDATRVPDFLPLHPADRADLEADSLREEARERRTAAAGAFWVPRISLFGVESFYKYGEFDPAILPNATFQNDYSFGLRLSWNLFDGGASYARKKLAEASAQEGAEATRKLRLVAPRELDGWRRKYRYQASVFRARQRSVSKSTESVRLATAAVRAGTKTHSEALDAELELFRAREGVIRAQVDAVEALGNLELDLGRPILDRGP